jgi:hypothetical protein
VLSSHTSSLRPGAIVALFAFVCHSACSSSATAPSPIPPAQPVARLLVENVSVRASLERWATSPWDIGYTYCYQVSPASPDVANMIFTRVDYTTLGPSAEVYDTSSDSSLTGQKVGISRGGCFFTYRDLNITRPIATAYRVTFQYAADGGAGPIAQSVTGTISSTVPPQPFIGRVTLTDDIKDLQKILRVPTPVTFTVSSVEGGAPPFLYQWRLNGFLLRDWDPNSVFTWDGATLNGRPVGSGSYTMSVAVRRSTWHETESAASVSFLLLF